MRHRLAVVLVLVLALAALSVAPASGEHGGHVLDEPRNGSRAVMELGDHIAAIARDHDTTPAELRQRLEHDLSLWVDTTGRLFYIDPTAPDHVEGDHIEGDVTTLEVEPALTTADPFTLHSRPGAQRTIYLDFDGHGGEYGGKVGGAWSSGYTGGDGVAEPYSVDADLAFSAGELDDVRSVWQRVAEDFAPFDVNVTTQEPAFEVIDRAGSSDLVYGTRVAITSTAKDCGCGGVAYVGVFDHYGGYGHAHYQPAFVYTKGAKNVTEAVSHEAGHNLGLSHDGTHSTGYYVGHGDWAPIMGVGYYEPITQWSRGEYSGANNTEDDFAIAGYNGAPLRADVTDSTSYSLSPTASPVTVAGTIERATDADAFTLTAAEAATVVITAVPAPTSPNLDIKLTLRVAAGTLVAEDDPLSSLDKERDGPATGLGAALTAQLAAGGSYTVSIDGVGARDPATDGYSGYGSLGDYTVSIVSSAPNAACVFDGATHVATATLVGGAAAIARTAGGAIQLNGVNCGDATVTNTDTVVVMGSSRGDALRLDLGNPFAPGYGESDDHAEIEFTVDLGAGHDQLQIGGGTQADVFRAGAKGLNLNNDSDLDVTVVGAEDTILRGGGGNDVIIGAGGGPTGAAAGYPLTVYGDAGNDRLTGGNAADRILGADGVSETTVLPDSDTLDGRGGADELDGEEGPDTVRFAGSAPVSVSLGEPGTASRGVDTDTLWRISNVVGTPGADSISGDEGPNVLDGGAGDDDVAARGGADKVYGRAGADDLYGGDGNDRIDPGPGGGNVYAEAGMDTLSLASATEGLTATLATSPGTVADHDGGSDYTSQVWDVESIVGTKFADTLTGDDFNNTLDGGLGNDTLTGLAGVDRIFGRLGDDSLSGGDGNDTLDPGAGGGVADGGTNYDTVNLLTATEGLEVSLLATPAYVRDRDGGTNFASQLSAVESITGTKLGDVLSGSHGANTIRGHDGNDELYGHDGKDKLDGGTHVSDPPGDRCVVGAGGDPAPVNCEAFS